MGSSSCQEILSLTRSWFHVGLELCLVFRVYDDWGGTYMNYKAFISKKAVNINAQEYIKPKNKMMF